MTKNNCILDGVCFSGNKNSLRLFRIAIALKLVAQALALIQDIQLHPIAATLWWQ